MAYLLLDDYEGEMGSATFHQYDAANAPINQVNADLEELLRSPALLLLSDDEALADLVLAIVKRPWKLVRQGTDEYILGIAKRPWKLVRQGADGYMNHKTFTQPNVQLVILDDQAVKEDDRDWLLAQIRKHFTGSSLLYVAGSQSDGNEKRARANGAHYYISKPLPPQRFGRVLQSFLQVDNSKDNR